MKKVVLLAGAVAAGMAIAPQAANAAAPEINEVQEINGGVSEADADATKAQADAKIVELRAVLANNQLTTDLKNDLQTVIAHLQGLSDECIKCFDSTQNSGSFGEVGDGHSDWPNGQLISDNWPSCVDDVSWLAPYKDYKGGLNKYSNLVDVYDLQKAKADEVIEKAYMYVNGLLKTKIQATTNYQQLNDIITEADGIINDTKAIYTDQDGTTTFKDLKDQILDATATDGAYRSAVNLKTKIDGLGSIKNEYVSEFELMTDLGIVTPNLEGAISTFKKKATEEAIKKINALEDSEQTRLQDIIDKTLTHHKASSLCKNLTGHDITNETGYTTAQSDLSAYLTSLQTDLTDWNAKEASQRATSDPLAITLWYDIQENNTNTFDTDVTAIETAIYKACLMFDKADIEKAIEELGSSTVLSAYKNELKDSRDGDNNQKANVESQLADWLNIFFNALGNSSLTSAKSNYITGSVAEKYWDTFNAYGSKSTYANLQAKTEVSYAEFRKGEAAIDKLAKTIDNIKTNWSDIKSLDKDLVELRLDIEVAKKKNGYDSSHITGLWGTNAAEASTSSTGEYKELFALRENVYNAIIAINDKDATAASNGKAGEWVGKASFETQIALENDHHDWLAEYQKENYDATQTMIAAIDVRFAEYQKVANFAITSDDPENPMKLADNTELYTTDTNKGVALNSIHGEETTTKLIYVDKFFAEIAEHFGNDDHTVDAATPVVKDGKPVDLMYDLITKWYNDADAQYIGEKNYVDDQWKEAERKGELKNNTVEGLQVTTSATDASGILVFTPEATTAGNEVVFGWLQKEIQEAFQKAVENEKANKDIHDKIKEANDYIAAGKNLINDKANIKVTATDVPARDYTTYDMENRKDVTVSEAAYTANNRLTHEGAYKGAKANNYDVTADLNADYYGKEEYSLVPTNNSIDYLAEFECGHYATETPNDKVWGWTKLEKVMADLETLEKQEYDKVASKDLLDGTTPMDLDSDGTNETFTETLTEVKENVDDITNEAFTQLYKNGLALVQEELNKAKTWAKSLDNKCHEDPALDTACSAEDVKNNPCGWDDTTATDDAHDLLKAIVEAWNAERALIATTDHNAEENDTVEKRDAFTAYVIKALNDIRDWKTKFAAMDHEHKIKLNVALDLAKKEATTLETYAQEAKFAKSNFNVDGADKATADNWAVDFNNRKFTFIDGNEYTFQQILAKLSADIAAAHVHGSYNPETGLFEPEKPHADDEYLGLENLIANGLKNFDDYIAAAEFVEKLCSDYAQALYDHHRYTELQTFAGGLEKFNLQTDYMKAIDANNAAHVELLKQLAQAQATLDAAKNDVIADKNEVYPVDYTTLTTTDLKAAQDVLDAQKTKIEEAWKAGKAADHIEVVEDVRTEVKGYELNLKEHDTDEKNVIEVYVDKAQAAKDLYAANKVAKEELLVQIQAILTNTNSTYEEVECAETAGCTQDFRTDLDNLKKALVGVDGNGGIKKDVNDGFAAKFAVKTAAKLKAEVDALETKLGQVKKDINEFNQQVLASADAALDMTKVVKAAFELAKDAEGKLVKADSGVKAAAAMVEGYENFEVRAAAPEITNKEVKYFDEIGEKVKALLDKIAFDDSHEGGHVANHNSAKYLKAMDDIQKELDKLVQAIKDNETAHNAQIEQRNKLYKKYECYDTTGLEAAVNDIDYPDFSLDTKFPEVPGYPETAVDPAGKDHTKAHTAVAEAIKALDAEIQKHYENGASNVEAAKTKIVEKETAYTTAFTHAKTNDSKFMEEYGNCKEADKGVVNPTPVNWMAAHFENGVNKYSDEANDQVTNAYKAIVEARKAYLADIKTDWYNNEAVEKVANNKGLLNTYKEKITAYNKAIADAKSNDTELLNELGMLGEKVELLVDLHLGAEHPETSTVLTDMRAQLAEYKGYCDTYATIKAQIVQDWEDEKLVVEEGKELSTTVADNRAAAKKYADWADKHNKLVAAINAYCADLEQINAKQEALNKVKTDIEALEIYNEQLNIDGEVVIDDVHTDGFDKDRKDLLSEIDRIQGLINGIDGLQTAADKEASAVKGLICDANKTNDRLYVDQVADQDEVQSATATLWENAQKQENLFKENENAFDSVYDAYTFKYTDKEGTEVSVSYADGLHNTMLATKAEATDFTAYDTDRKELTGLALEAFDKFVNTSIKDEEGNVIVKSLVEQLEDEINALVTRYKAENAASFDVKKYEELKNKIDYARSVAEGVDDSMGDICNKDLVAGQDGFVDEYDFMYLLDEMVLKNRPTTYDFPYCYGDLDLNQKYEANDLVLLSNYIWYKNLDGVQKAQANRGAFEAELNAEVVHNTVAIAINNNFEFNALQFDVVVPEGARITDLIATTRAKGLVVASNEYEQNTYRVVIVGMGGNKHITGNEGNVISFNVLGAEGEVEIFNVSAANGISFDLNGASLFIGQTTGIDEVAAEGETDIFSLDGIRQSVMKAGVNIVRGANGVAKKIFNK